MGVHSIFGYLKPYKDEMKLSEYERYKKYYCTLCTELSKFGFISRFFLSYELTFLLIFLDGISKEQEICDYKCPFHKPKKNNVSICALEFAAFINYWLIIKKFEDDYNDSNNFLIKFIINQANKFLKHNKLYKLRSQKFEVVIESLSNQLEEYYYIENHSEDFDTLSNGFASFLSGLFEAYFSQYENNIDISIINKISFNVAKLIYVADAFDDYLRDVKKERFNPLRGIFLECDNQNVFVEEVFNIIKCLSSQTVEYLKMLNCNNMDLILNHIQYFDHVLVKKINCERGKFTWKNQFPYQIFIGQ